MTAVATDGTAAATLTTIATHANVTGRDADAVDAPITITPTTAGTAFNGVTVTLPKTRHDREHGRQRR